MVQNLQLLINGCIVLNLLHFANKYKFFLYNNRFFCRWIQPSGAVFHMCENVKTRMKSIKTGGNGVRRCKADLY